jgi:hypothetical protein
VEGKRREVKNNEMKYITFRARSVPKGEKKISIPNESNKSKLMKYM